MTTLLTRLQKIGQFNLPTQISPKLIAPVLVGGLCAAVLAVFGAVYSVCPNPIVAQIVSMGVMLGGMNYYFRVFLPKRFQKRGKHEVLRQIEASGDVRFIAPLVDAWVGGKNLNCALIYEIVQVLTGLLPYLNAENADALPAKQRKLLYRAMGTVERNLSKIQVKLYGDLFRDCMVEAIRALTRIGDTGALLALRQLYKLKDDSEWYGQIHTVVQESLLTLELLAVEEKQGKTLLRASTKEDVTGDTLLRSVAETTENDPKTLLRPADEQDIPPSEKK